MKLIHTVCGAKFVRVYWCREWQEYQVKSYDVGNNIKGKLIGTYHTDDKTDAIATANSIAYK
jgi:hypothetical protein